MKPENVKVMLHGICLKRVDERIDMILRQMESIVEARNNETKSSAGDKFETGRAMMQLEEDKAAAQLADANRLRLTLSNLDPRLSTQAAAMGSIVQTNQGIYYLTVGLGKVMLNQQIYYCVSLVSPIGQALLGLKVGASIYFRGQEIIVEKII